jgi:hypothetical protein
MTTTIFCVQTYWRDSRRLNSGALRQFKQEEQAREAGLSASRRHDGVIVYSLTGEPQFEFWGDPVVLATHGETPLKA